MFHTFDPKTDSKIMQLFLLQKIKVVIKGFQVIRSDLSIVFLWHLCTVCLKKRMSLIIIIRLFHQSTLTASTTCYSDRTKLTVLQKLRTIGRQLTEIWLVSYELLYCILKPQFAKFSIKCSTKGRELKYFHTTFDKCKLCSMIYSLGVSFTFLMHII